MGAVVFWKNGCDIRILSSSLNHIDLWIGSDTDGWIVTEGRVEVENVGLTKEVKRKWE